MTSSPCGCDLSLETWRLQSQEWVSIRKILCKYWDFMGYSYHDNYDMDIPWYPIKKNPSNPYGIFAKSMLIYWWQPKVFQERGAGWKIPELNGTFNGKIMYIWMFKCQVWLEGRSWKIRWYTMKLKWEAHQNKWTFGWYKDYIFGWYLDDIPLFFLNHLYK